jgi:hypothetical protein
MAIIPYLRRDERNRRYSTTALRVSQDQAGLAEVLAVQMNICDENREKTSVHLQASREAFD